MARGFASSLQSIRQGGPNIGNTLAGQISNIQRERQQAQAAQRQNLQELMLKQQKAETEARRKAVQSQTDLDKMRRQREEQLNNRLFGVSRQLLSASERNPEAVRARLEQSPGVAQRLQIDPSSPGWRSQLRAAYDRYRAQATGEVPDEGQPSRIEELKAAGFEPGTDEFKEAYMKSRGVRGDEENVETFSAYSPSLGRQFEAVRTPEGIKRQTVDETGEIDFVAAPEDTYGVSSEIGGPREDVLGESEQKELRNTEISTRNLIGMSRDALELLKEEKDVNTFVARGAGLIEDLKQEAMALSNFMGDDASELFDPSQYEGKFSELGVENARMKSLLISMGYHLARAREDGRLSNQDVALAIETFGGNRSDPEALASTIKDTTKRAVRNFKNAYRVRRNEEFNRDLGLEAVENFSLKDEGKGGEQEQPVDEPQEPSPTLRYNPETGKIEEIN